MMKFVRSRTHTLPLAVLAAGLAVGLSAAQTTPSTQSSPSTQNQPGAQTQGGQSSQAAAAVKAKKKAAQQAAQTGAGRQQTIPIETAPPTPPPAPLTARQQEKADEKLLERQEAQSDKAAAVNDQQVQRAQERQDTLQNQQRIQDAPGPPQAVPTQAPTAIPPFQSVDPSQLPQPGQTVVPAPNTPVPPR